MLERRIAIVNSLGLHARAAAQLVRKASTYRCWITLSRTDTGISANAKSILSVLHLAAGNGVTISISTDGVDEIEAIEAMESLFKNGFGEK